MRFLKVGRGMLFVEYPKCSTCKKAKQWLLENGFSFEDRDIKLDNPRAEEIEKWHKRSQLPLKKFFNTSGLVYKSFVGFKVDEWEKGLKS